MPSDASYRAGLLTVDGRHGPRAVQSALPPGHRIAATRHDGYSVECLIEGPGLPLVEPGLDPRPVFIIFTMAAVEAGISVSGSWSHSWTETWHVGTWPDLAAFHDREAR